MGLLASELRLCSARALRHHPEAWAHTPAGQELWHQASRGQEKRSGLFEAGGSSGLHDGGCVEGSLVTRVLVRDAQCGYPHGRAGVAGGDPSRAWASGLRGPGGSRSRRSHRHGVGSLKKGLSVHPEVAFGAL